MSRTRRRSHRDREPEVDWEIAVTPGTGALGLTGYPARPIAPAPARVFVVACEVPDCKWESAEESTVVACKRDLVAHAWAAHSPRVALGVDVRVRSRKYRFLIEVVDL